MPHGKTREGGLSDKGRIAFLLAKLLKLDSVSQIQPQSPSQFTRYIRFPRPLCSPVHLLEKTQIRATGGHGRSQLVDIIPVVDVPGDDPDGTQGLRSDEALLTDGAEMAAPFNGRKICVCRAEKPSDGGEAKEAGQPGSPDPPRPVKSDYL